MFGADAFLANVIPGSASPILDAADEVAEGGATGNSGIVIVCFSCGGVRDAGGSIVCGGSF